jgi:hypothetical protein
MGNRSRMAADLFRAKLSSCLNYFSIPPYYSIPLYLPVIIFPTLGFVDFFLGWRIKFINFIDHRIRIRTITLVAPIPFPSNHLVFIVRGSFLIVFHNGSQSLCPIALIFYVRCIRIHPGPWGTAMNKNPIITQVAAHPRTIHVLTLIDQSQDSL